MGFLNNDTYKYGDLNIKGLSQACTYDDFFHFWRDDLFSRLMRLFIYDGLGDSLPQKEIEERLYLLGHCGITQYDGKMTAFFGSFFGPTVYQDEFTNYTVHSPIYSNTYKINDDIVVIENNSLKIPCIEHVNHYSYLLAHAEVTLIKACIEARDAGGVPIAENEKAKESLLAYQKAMYQGKVSVVSDLAGIGVNYLGADRRTSVNIVDLWEVRKNLLTIENAERGAYVVFENKSKPKLEIFASGTEVELAIQVASFYADIGVRASFDKRSNAVIDEVTSDTSMLLYNISDMLEERKKGCDRVNKLFGTNWSVRLSDEIDYNTENEPEVKTSEEVNVDVIRD